MERTRAQFRLRDSTTQTVRSLVLDAAEISATVSVAAFVRDPDDNPLIDVLDQTDAEWLCTDDAAIHELDRADVIGIGELTRLLEDGCHAITTGA